MSRMTPAPPRRWARRGSPRHWPAWAVAEGPFGVRLLDVGIVIVVIAAVEINVIVGNGPGSVPLGPAVYLVAALMGVPNSSGIGGRSGC